MLADFFQLGPIPADQMTGTYDLRMVFLSYLVAIFASYIALDITGRLRDSTDVNSNKLLWICGGACAMGAGIWSMHFIGMLAFTMSGMPITFDPFWTGISMAVAIIASAFALFLLKIPVIRVPQLMLGGVILGFGIVSMHYLGMQAMKITVAIHYLPSLFILSICIAIVASEAAIYLALKSNQVAQQYRLRLKIVSALIMGAAIAGMHYTGMFAAVFTALPHPVVHSDSEINPQILASCIAVITFVILGIAFFVSAYKANLNQQTIETARQAGMAEVAVNVLHNVGNVLNSLYVSSNLVAEKIKKSRLTELSSLSKMLTEHQDDLGNFITNNPQGSKIPVYVKVLSEHWRDEQATLTTEMETVIKNLQHIKDIISVQQDLSKTREHIQVIGVEELLEEAVLICGFQYDLDNITLEKHYGKLRPVLFNKLKLIQILVNLLRNAKDALIASNNPDKKLILQLGILDNKTIFIKVTDNGVGISPENMKNLFTHGFSTKPSGHGFGLHASTQAIKEMEGTLQAQSDGIDLGATLTVTLPYKTPGL
jgi:NO-binding membrane sensor protein with MHYT domain